jgi:hypothetical protein
VLNHRFASLAIFLIGAAFCSLGCGSRYPTSNYGLSEGSSARVSPDAVSAFRNMCDETNRKSMKVGSLSNRTANKLSSLIWIPEESFVHSAPVLDWMEEWLKKGGKTLIYVGRDYSPTADYWDFAGAELQSQEKNKSTVVGALENKALEELKLDSLQSGQRDRIALPWALLENEAGLFETVEQLEGPWASDLQEHKHRIRVRSFFRDWSSADSEKVSKQLDWQSEVSDSSKPVQSSFPKQWTTGDMNNLEIAKKAEENDLNAEVMLASKSNKPLITVLSKEEWQGSQVILLANSCFISNYSMTHRGNRVLAHKLIADLPQGKVGFLTLARDPRVSTGDDEEEQRGFEMLTEWPLNVISFHAFFLGMIVLASLFPILGSPKKLPELSTQNFAQHVEALGALLFRSSDRFYALTTIADYFRVVRKDPNSPWAKYEETIHQQPSSPFQSEPSPPQSMDSQREA